MTLSDFCDLVWAEIWDDVSPMSDHGRYHMIVTSLFIEGKEPHEITWVDEDGKKHSLADGQTSVGQPLPSTALSAIDKLKAEVAAATNRAE